MANEVSVSLSLNVRNGNYSDSWSGGNIQADQNVQLSAGGVVQVGTAVATISLGEVTTAAYSGFRNLSTATSGTAYIALGVYDGTNLQEFVHLRRGLAAILPLRSDVTLGAKAYGQAENMHFIVLSE